MNAEKLKRLQSQVRIGGKGTPRRKKKVVHQTAATDDKKLQSSLKKISVSTIPGIEEVNIIKDDLSVIHFNNPKAQASLTANTFAITGHGEHKKVVEMLPEILPQLGQDTVIQLRRFANNMTASKALSSVAEEDDVPTLVENFDEPSKDEIPVVTKPLEQVKKVEDKPTIDLKNTVVKDTQQQKVQDKKKEQKKTDEPGSKPVESSKPDQVPEKDVPKNKTEKKTSNIEEKVDGVQQNKKDSSKKLEDAKKGNQQNQKKTDNKQQNKKITESTKQSEAGPIAAPIGAEVQSIAVSKQNEQQKPIEGAKVIETEKLKDDVKPCEQANTLNAQQKEINKQKTEENKREDIAIKATSDSLKYPEPKTADDQKLQGDVPKTLETSKPSEIQEVPVMPKVETTQKSSEISKLVDAPAIETKANKVQKITEAIKIDSTQKPAEDKLSGTQKSAGAVKVIETKKPEGEKENLVMQKSAESSKKSTIQISDVVPTPVEKPKEQIEKPQTELPKQIGGKTEIKKANGEKACEPAVAINEKHAEDKNKIIEESKKADLSEAKEVLGVYKAPTTEMKDDKVQESVVEISEPSKILESRKQPSKESVDQITSLLVDTTKAIEEARKIVIPSEEKVDVKQLIQDEQLEKTEGLSIKEKQKDVVVVSGETEKKENQQPIITKEQQEFPDIQKTPAMAIPLPNVEKPKEQQLKCPKTPTTEEKPDTTTQELIAAFLLSPSAEEPKEQQLECPKTPTTEEKPVVTPFQKVSDASIIESAIITHDHKICESKPQELPKESIEISETIKTELLESAKPTEKGKIESPKQTEGLKFSDVLKMGELPKKDEATILESPKVGTSDQIPPKMEEAVKVIESKQSASKEPEVVAVQNQDNINLSETLKPETLKKDDTLPEVPLDIASKIIEQEPFVAEDKQGIPLAESVLPESSPGAIKLSIQEQTKSTQEMVDDKKDVMKLAAKQKPEAAKKQEIPTGQNVSGAKPEQKRNEKAKSKTPPPAKKIDSKHLQQQQQHQAKKRTDSESKKRTDSESKPRTESESKKRTDSESKPRTESESKKRTDSESKPRTESESKKRTDSESKPRMESEPKKRTESESKKTEDNKSQQKQQQTRQQQQPTPKSPQQSKQQREQKPQPKNQNKLEEISTETADKGEKPDQQRGTPRKQHSPEKTSPKIDKPVQCQQSNEKQQEKIETPLQQQEKVSEKLDNPPQQQTEQQKTEKPKQDVTDKPRQDKSSQQPAKPQQKTSQKSPPQQKSQLQQSKKPDTSNKGGSQQQPQPKQKPSPPKKEEPQKKN